MVACEKRTPAATRVQEGCCSHRGHLSRGIAGELMSKKRGALSDENGASLKGLAKAWKHADLIRLVFNEICQNLARLQLMTVFSSVVALGSYSKQPILCSPVVRFPFNSG